MLVFGIVTLVVALAMTRKALKSKTGDALVLLGISAMLFFAAGVYMIVLSSL